MRGSGRTRLLGRITLFEVRPLEVLDGVVVLADGEVLTLGADEDVLAIFLWPAAVHELAVRGGGSGGRRGRGRGRFRSGRRGFGLGEGLGRLGLGDGLDRWFGHYGRDCFCRCDRLAVGPPVDSTHQ